MIRFCDREFGCVEYTSLTRSDMKDYFLSGHKDDVLCVYDSFDAMGYVGSITYDSYERSINVGGAIIQEYLVLGEDMWQESRKYFEYCGGLQLPVFDQEYQLVCFAYEDADANREIRMLRELLETPAALRFSDVYPEYQCVRIYGFNELAYFFAKYLERQGVPVEVVGVMWQGIFEGDKCQVPDYKCMEIYAEGLAKTNQNWKENLLRSVSVEFECIDKIYEENIKNNIIKDSEGDYNNFIDILKSDRKIVLLGTGKDAQNAYDFLVGQGIDICCFADGSIKEQSHRLFGKRIMSVREARNTYDNLVFVECTSQNSAWGFGQVDYYDYIGYRRNQNYFLLKDYIAVSSNGLINALSSWKVVLIGEAYICKYLAAYLSSKNIPVIGYLNALSQDVRWEGMEIEASNVGKDAMCLIAAPDFFASNDFDIHEPNELKNSLIKYLVKEKIDNYSDYFSNMSAYMHMEESNNKYLHKQLMPKRIVIGSIEIANGTTFVAGLLDGHPNILSIHNGYSFKDNLFWTCLRLSMVDAKDVLSVFWDICKEEDRKWIRNPILFNEKMAELLSGSSRFTSQELFVIIYISYMRMFEKDIEVTEGIIYWDPHYLAAREKEDCAKWLGADQVHCDIINVVRNACMGRGALVKYGISREWAKAKLGKLELAYQGGVYKFPDIEKEIYKWSDRLIIQFEELKCHPQEALMKICTEWGMEWSDSLMQTTYNGKKEIYHNGEKAISDFDLSPVYNTYEKYFSEFDRFRVMLIQMPWQRTYGYPYVQLKQFSRREIQEMFLQKFRFEDLEELSGVKLELGFRIKLQQMIREQLKKIRMLEILAELETENVGNN